VNNSRIHRKQQVNRRTICGDYAFYSPQRPVFALLRLSI
jgi:hypothetical protein